MIVIVLSVNFVFMIVIGRGHHLSGQALLLQKTDHDSSCHDHHTYYTSALATIRCFTTPGCFPSAKCRNGHPQKLQRDKKWEEQAFCVDDLKIDSTKKPCLVYSFGIHESYDWEEKVAKLFGCDVHAFDPTMNHNTNLAPGVTFHKLGLQALGTNMSQTHAAEYATIDPNLLLSLDQIMKRLGHEQRSLDLLMLDCEGCEWGVLHNLACSKQSALVTQIVAEFHFQKSLGLETEADVLNAAEAVQCLWEDRWHVTSMEESGSGRENWIYAPGVASILHREGMLLYIALQRIPNNEATPTELLEAMATAGHQLGKPFEDTVNRYGFNQSKWPPQVRDELRPLLVKSQLARTQYSSAARPNVKFDLWETMEEH